MGLHPLRAQDRAAPAEVDLLRPVVEGVAQVHEVEIGAEDVRVAQVGAPEVRLPDLLGRLEVLLVEVVGAKARPSTDAVAGRRSSGTRRSGGVPAAGA